VNKRPLTPGYIFFYLFFLPDTWQILIGILVAYLLTPRIAPPDLGLFGDGMLYVMIAAIGYAVSVKAGRGITRLLKKRILGDKRP
jgi:hypothetical protein